jgi:WD40 repeat protein
VNKQIIHSPSQGLAVRSAALVARGLRDLTRNSNWLTKKIFEGHSPTVAVSSTGQVCTIAPTAPDLFIYDIEANQVVQALAVPARGLAPGSDVSAAFAFSSTGLRIVAASTAWQPRLHSLDRRKNTLLGTFGEFTTLPRQLAWSNAEKYFAVATADAKNPVVRLWQTSEHSALFAGEPLSTTAASDSMERQTYEAEFGDEGAFSGYGCTAFSPDDKSLATALEIKGDWADDSIVLMSVPTLEKQTIHSARGHVTHLTWTPASDQIVYCASGQAYRLTLGASDAEELPFGAEMCAHHPELPVCLCFSSWVKGSSQGRLFLVDMNRLTVYDEREASEIGDVRWSLDGTKAFAVTREGVAYVYEPSVL